jgi:LPS export ABC transporter permease LptG/LPS export ABC transporter permease LptF
VFRLLNRYIFRETLTSAALGTLLATFVIFLRTVDQLFELLVQGNAASLKKIALLFAYAVPPVLPLTIPFGVLVGILIGLGRMGADGEIVAMRASGISSRKVVAPVLAFAVIGMGCAGFASLRLTPLAARRTTEIVNDLMKNGLSADIQPRVFDEDFPNIILYVGNVQPGAAGDPVRWGPVFIADVSPPESRKSGLKGKATGPLIMVAREAIAVSEPQQRRIQLSMLDGSRHEMGTDAVAHDEHAAHWEMALDAAPAVQKVLRASAMRTTDLLAYKRGPDLLENRIELHKRFALPVACIMLAMVGIPLGIATRKGGKSAGYVNAFFLAFFCYWLAFITLTGQARLGKLSVPVAIWLPDALFGLAGIVLLWRMERPGDRDLMAAMQGWFGRHFQALKSKAGAKSAQATFKAWRIPLLPQLLDTYILSRFLTYFALLLSSFVALTLVFNFFDLMLDMVRNKIPLTKMFTYLFFLTPELIYRTLPVSVLVAVLVALGVLSKQNEITAFKACGVSLYRLALPILIGGTVLSGGLFAFDHYYVPGANRRQESLRAEIKGQPTQTYLKPERKWIMGKGSRIYYYRYFDPSESMMAEINVFELDPKSFAMVRQIEAQRAIWRPTLKAWVFENGWFSDFRAGDRKYNAFQVSTFPELNEPPEYFLKDPPKDEQMNFIELGGYIRDLRQSGFDTMRLQVEFYRKFSVPIFALIMALIAVPFGFMVGNRGAMTGIGLAIIIAIAYWGVSSVFDKAGGVGQLPPTMAAWSPDVIFAMAGLYLVLRLRS